MFWEFNLKVCRFTFFQKNRIVKKDSTTHFKPRGRQCLPDSFWRKRNGSIAGFWRPQMVVLQTKSSLSLSPRRTSTLTSSVRTEREGISGRLPVGLFVSSRKTHCSVSGSLSSVVRGLFADGLSTRGREGKQGVHS